MKKNITLALAFLASVSLAQYNNTYDVNANKDKLDPSFVITNKKGHSTTVSFTSMGIEQLHTNYFILTKHDAFGNVIYNNRIDPFNAPTDCFTNVEALIETDDEGTLVAGYYYADENNKIHQPFLVKVDVKGNLQWTKVYPVNQENVRVDINKISLYRVVNDEKENYFIVGAGNSEQRKGDVATHVIKVANDGNMLFSKKYYPVNQDQFSTVRDFPGDIEFTTRDKFFMITGYRSEGKQIAPNTYSYAEQMYFFGIDNNGKVVTSFLTLESESIPLHQDIVYNKDVDKFATTFTHENQEYLQVTGLRSLIGFINVNSSLTISNPTYIWHNEGSEHNTRSISLCNDGHYLLGTDVYINDNVFTGHNPSWMKVDVFGRPANNLLRYNLKDDATFGHHTTTFNPITGDEEHVLANKCKSDLRMIRTDINGKACGMVEYPPYNMNYAPKQNLYSYSYKQQKGTVTYEPYEKLSDPGYSKCDGEGSSYRTTGIAQTESNGSILTVYPSAISIANAYVTIENKSIIEIKMEMLNAAGQLVYFNNQVAAGKTEVRIDGVLSTGIYLVRLYSVTGELVSTHKILVTE